MPRSHSASLAACCALAICPTGFAAEKRVLAFGNRTIIRHLEVGAPGLRTTAITNRLTGLTLPVRGPEFRLYLPKGQIIDADAFRLTGLEQTKSEDGVEHLTVSLVHPERKVEATVAFQSGQGASYLRKTVSLRSQGATFVLRDIDVECIETDADTDLGGRGQPLYVAEQFFLGLEHPSAYNLVDQGRIVLRHYPGKTIGSKTWASKTALLGAAQKGQVADAFMHYVESIRRPPRSYLLYNSWYDLRSKEMTVERLAETYEDIRKHLAPYGVTLASFVPDDGWQNKQSIWEPIRSFLPKGYAPLAETLEKGGTRLGLWMPLTGVNLDVEWGMQQGYEAGSKRHYCMSGPKYNQAIRKVLREKILDWRVGYFKHDFNSFSCGVEGHGHLPETRYGFEANVDAEIELLKYSRSLRPDIFLNVTSSMWLSPWWLPYADAIWMGCGDFGRIKTVPAIEPRDWAITYRDHHLWRRFRKERLQYPMTATMTHGVIYGRRCMLGGKKEPLDKWSDNAVWYFLRGMQMKELYITPSILNDAQWDVLGRACRWATDYAPVLRNAELILGDPGAGEVYGFASQADGVSLFGFRNPSIAPQEATISGRYLIGGKPARLRLIYPFKCDAGTLTPDGAVRQTLGPNEIRIYRGDAATDVKATALNAATFGPVAPVLKVAANGGGVMEVRVDPLRQDLTKVTLALLLEDAYDVNARKGFTIRCGDKVLSPTEVRLEGSRILHTNVPTTPHTLKIAASTKALDGPFRANIKLSGWLIADYKGEPGPTPATNAQLACPYAERRRVGVPLGATAEIDLSKRREIPVTEADLKETRAAVLHLLVFGSNSEKQYAGKPLLLNGQEVANVPGGGRPLDVWRRKLVRIPKGKLSLIRLKNEIQFGNRGGDCYKLKDVALAVQLKNGQWVETSFDRSVYCSVAGWLYKEGTTFVKGMSPAIAASFTR